MGAPAAATALPQGAIEANWFQLFNALSWQITLGAPVILYAKSLGAGVLILGIIGSLTPLLTIVQLPVIRFLPRFGYRGFILAGWTARTVTIFAVALVPLLHTFRPSTRLALFIALLFAFNLLRGLASGAWWPWICELIPGHIRGRFLSRDQTFIQIGCLTSLIAASFILHGQALPRQFALVFLLSAIAQTISIFYVRLIPDVTAPERYKQTSHRVPWLQMLRWPPFFRLIFFNILFQFIAGGLGVFTVAFLRDETIFSDGRILLLSATAFVGALMTLTSIGRWLDRAGSRPVLRACLLFYLLILLGWWALAAKLIPSTPATIGLLYLLLGIASANFSVANSRLMLATIPLMGRNHFFALYTIITSLALGAAPIAWGALLKAIGHASTHTSPISWNRYSIYFAGVMLMAILALAYSLLLHEQTTTIDSPEEPRPV